MASNEIDTHEGDEGGNAQKRKRFNTLQVPTNTRFVSAANSLTDLGNTQPPMVLSHLSLIFYKTLRKIERGILKARHHKEFLQQHLEKGTSPRGLQANITSQIPDISTDFQIKWETAHLDFATNLTTVLTAYWANRLTKLTAEKDQLLTKVADECTTEEHTEIVKLTLQPPNKPTEGRKTGGSRSPRNRSPRATSSTSQTNY